MSFEISKWYMDCTSDGGDAFIGYAARLRWHRLTVSYAATLVWRDGTVTAQATLLGSSVPRTNASSVEWRALGANCTWQRGISRSPFELVNDASGKIACNPTC